MPTRSPWALEARVGKENRHTAVETAKVVEANGYECECGVNRRSGPYNLELGNLCGCVAVLAAVIE